jgi:hypothetical protein
LFITTSSDIFMTSFPKGQCSLGDSCCVPQHELQKQCPGCNGWIHALCGNVLEEDEGEFSADTVINPSCDPTSSKNSLDPA